MNAPSVVAFYSYVTGVSLELPVGFEFMGEDDVSANYADRTDDGPVIASTPVLRVRVVGELDGEDGVGAVRDLADGFDAADRETISRRDLEIDGCPATCVESREAGRVLHQTAVAADGRLLSIIGTAPADELLPVFDAALDSVRFIRL
ncbi:MAG: hypothetical protein ABI345_08580 [Jatrophihabitans sp.]